MQKEINNFMRELKGNRKKPTAQQYKTIKGQALKCSVADAKKGLYKVLGRRGRR